MEDLVDERSAVIEAINKRSTWEAVCAEAFLASTDTPEKVCLEEVENCDIYVSIFKNKYGFIPKDNNPEELSVTVMEYKVARMNNLSILIFIHKLVELAEERLKSFLGEVMDFKSGHFVKKYCTIEELVQYVIESIDRTITREFVKIRKRIRQESRIDTIYNLDYFKKLKEELQ